MTEEQIIKRREEIELRSEEVQELLGHIPHWIIRWGMTSIFLTIVVVLVGSWCFQYPDVLVSSVVVTTTHPPASVVARTDGKLDVLFVEDQQQNVLACVENTASYGDVVLLKAQLETLRKRLVSDDITLSGTFRDDYTLGTLQTSYTNFLARYEEYRHFVTLDYFHQKITSLEKQIQQHRSLYERSSRQKHLLQQELELSQRQYERYRYLKDQALVSQKDLETLQSTVLQKTYALEEAESGLDNINIQISRLDASKLDVTLQYDEQKKQLQLAVQAAYDNLYGQIISWEHANLLKAPIDGTVTFTEYWSENQNVKAGDVVMTIVPDGSSHLLGKVRLPVQGAGKVKVGQKVNIKFANYPSREYGMVTGIVERISLVPSDTYYVVEVSFPEGLTTNYGNTLPFTQEMQGAAEIITEDRRLLERFFQPIQALIQQHLQLTFLERRHLAQSRNSPGVSNRNH